MSVTSTGSASNTPLAQITRGEWALIFVLMAIQFTHMVDFVIIMPLGDRLMKELEISPAQFGVIVSAYAIAAGLASLTASLFMDRFDRKSVLLTMYGGFVASTLFCGLSQSYELLLASRILAGIFGGLAAVSIMAIIGDVFPSEKRGRATGAITASFSVASIVGLPLGLWVAGLFGRGAPFIFLAGVSLPVLLVAVFRIPPIVGHLNAPRSHPFKELVVVAGRGEHQRAFAFTFFLVMGTFMVASFIAPYLCATNGWTEADLWPIYLAGGIMSLGGMRVIGTLTDKVERLMLFRIFAAAAIVMGFIATNLPECSIVVASLVMGTFMVCATGRFVPAQAMILGVAEPRYRGSFMSLNTAVQHLATGIAPLLAGLLVYKTPEGQLHGYPLVGIVAAVVSGVSLILGGILRSGSRPIPKDQIPETTTDAVVEAAVA